MVEPDDLVPPVASCLLFLVVPADLGVAVEDLLRRDQFVSGPGERGDDHIHVVVVLGFDVLEQKLLPVRPQVGGQHETAPQFFALAAGPMIWRAICDRSISLVPSTTRATRRSRNQLSRGISRAMPIAPRICMTLSTTRKPTSVQ